MLLRGARDFPKGFFLCNRAPKYCFVSGSQFSFSASLKAMLFERVPDAEREEVFIVQMRSAKLSNGLNKNK